jgi:hypothetical protein
MPRLKSWIIGTAAACCMAVTIAIAGDDITQGRSSPVQLAQLPSIPSRNRQQQRKPEQPKPRSLTDKGIVSAVTADSISIVSDNKVWMLQAQPGCVIEVTGRAEPSYLKAGQLVRFYGEFDKKYKSLAPLKKLEIISVQIPGIAPGVFPDTLPPEPEKEKSKKGAEEKAKVEEKEEKEEPAGDEAKGTPESGTPMMVVGSLKVVKDGDLLISAGSRTIRVELAEEPEISVSLPDFTLSKRGDAVTKFSCDYFQPGAGYLKLLQIELNDPLEGAKKPMRKPTAKPIAKQPTKTGGKAK